MAGWEIETSTGCSGFECVQSGLGVAVVEPTLAQVGLVRCRKVQDSAGRYFRYVVTAPACQTIEQIVGGVGGRAQPEAIGSGFGKVAHVPVWVPTRHHGGRQVSFAGTGDLERGRTGREAGWLV